MAVEIGNDAACDGDDTDAGEGSTMLLALCFRDRLKSLFPMSYAIRLVITGEKLKDNSAVSQDYNKKRSVHL